MNPQANSPTIVLVEDDPTIRTVLSMAIKKKISPCVFAANNGDDGLTLIRKEKPSVAILDIMLPGLDGISICKALRNDATLSATKVIMLTAKTQERDIICGLDTGADDYVTKPFSLDILLARIRAQLRSAAAPQSKDYSGLTLSQDGLTASIGEEEIALTKTELTILKLFLSHPGRIYTREQIIDSTQDEESTTTFRAVDVQIVGLRRKLGSWASHIETARGLGYRVKL